MRKIILLNTMVLLAAGLMFADLRLLQPKYREVLKRGKLYPIRWQAPSSEARQGVTILIETADGSNHWLVDSSRSKEDKVFYWTVGQINNGTLLPAGDYKLSLESDDDKITGGVFTIKFSPAKRVPKFEALRNKIFIIPMLPPPPQCPQCLHLDFREIKLMFGDPEGLLEVKLYKNDQLVADLGKLGQGQSLPDFLRVKPIPSSLPLINKHKATDMEILLLNHKKEIVHTQRVQLKSAKVPPVMGEKPKSKKKDIGK